MTVAEILAEAQRLCKAAKKDEHAARMLLMDRLNLESFELFAAMDRVVRPEITSEYFKTLKRYVDDGEPIQYILGYAYFAGRDLFVDESVLIPRPETEELVYEVLLQIDEQFADETAYPQIRVADIGTGSGAIAVSLAAEEPRVKMYATDISEDALVIARKNADSYAPNVEFFSGDMLQPLIERRIIVDVLVSNPPYIPENETVQPIVEDNEPHVALFGGTDGLAFYRVILEQASQILAKNQYLLAFEIGYDQAERLKQLAQLYFPQALVWVKQDLQGKDRMLFISQKNN